MTSTCPECGSSMEFEQREVRLLSGTCPSCSKEFAFVEGATVSSRLSSVAPRPSRPTVEEGPEGEAVEGGPRCEECGSPLTFRAGQRGSLEAICTDCDATTTFVPQGNAPRGAWGRERRPRPLPPEEAAPRGRPCRKCGATLAFSTDEEGNLVGECASCGNRFTLPPRSGPGGGYRRSPWGRDFTRRDDVRTPRRGRPPYRGARGNRGSRPFPDADRPRSPRFDEDLRRKRRRRAE